MIQFHYYISLDSLLAFSNISNKYTAGLSKDNKNRNASLKHQTVKFITSLIHAWHSIRVNIITQEQKTQIPVVTKEQQQKSKQHKDDKSGADIIRTHECGKLSSLIIALL